MNSLAWKNRLLWVCEKIQRFRRTGRACSAPTGTYDRARRGRACPTRLAAICIAFGLVGAGPVHIDDTRMREQYRSRRIELRKSLADGVIVLFGRAEQD